MLKRSRIDQQERSAVLLRSSGKLLQPPHEVIVCHGLGPRQPAQLENVPGVIIGQDTKPVVKKLRLYVYYLLSSAQPGRPSWVRFKL